MGNSKRSRSIGIHYGNGKDSYPVPFEEDRYMKQIWIKEANRQRNYGKYISKWYKIQKHTPNKIQVNVMTSGRRNFANIMGIVADNIVLSGEEIFAKYGLIQNQIFKRDAWRKFILPEGSSGEKAYIGATTMSRVEAGVIPIGSWTTYTEEFDLFSNFETVEDIMMNYGEFGGQLIDSYYRDAMYYGAGFRYSLLKYGTGYDSLRSPILSKLTTRITGRMKLYGAKPVSMITGSSMNYGVEPIDTKYVMHIPTIAEESIMENPYFRSYETYGAIAGRRLENEIGAIGSVRVVTDDEMLVKEDEVNNRIVVEAMIIAQNPVDGIKIESRKGGGIDLVHIPLSQKDKSDKLNRFGVVGFKSFIGSITTHPERVAIIEMYLDLESIEDMVNNDKKCNDRCLVCTEDGDMLKPEEDECTDKCEK